MGTVSISPHSKMILNREVVQSSLRFGSKISVLKTGERGRRHLNPLGHKGITESQRGSYLVDS